MKSSQSQKWLYGLEGTIHTLPGSLRLIPPRERGGEREKCVERGGGGRAKDRSLKYDG